MKRLSQPTAIAAITLLSLALTLAPGPAQARQQAPAARIGLWELSSVDDWRAGSADGLLVTNNAGGELRLDDGQTSGSFLSAPFKTEFAANAAGVTWRADLVEGTELRLELRGRADPPAEDDSDAGWGPWLPLVAGDARSESEQGALATPDVAPLPAGSQYLQLRASFSSQVARASALLEEVAVSYLHTAQTTPIFPAGLPRRPLFFGPDTLTPRPAVISRQDWTGRVQAARPVRANPRGVILHQIAATTTPSTTLELLRAQLAYQTEVLGWEDLSYHYVIDDEGNLFEGRLGGPTSRVDRLNGGDVAVHVAMIAPADEALSEQAQAVLINLLAWLGQAYDLSPTGEHTVLRDGEATRRPNIVGHAEVAPGAPDPSEATRELLPALRTRIDASTVRARWYFAEGNVADYSQRLSFYNPTGAQADARVTLIPPGSAPVAQVIAVPARARVDLVVNDLVAGADALPAIVESSAPILAERSMGLTTDIDGGPGISELSRVWYFAEGSTEGDTRTYLLLFNPNAAQVSATVTYMRRDGTQAEQDVQIPPQSRTVITVNDITLPDGSRPLAGTGFGMRVVATQPIAVERTMRFGLNQAGMHTGRGISALSRRWYFAEGTTEGDFNMRLLVLNPNDQPANVETIFSGPDGVGAPRRYAIPARSQLAINVNEVVPGQGVSTLVQADRPVAVERAMSFNQGAAGTVGAGATQPSYTWAFVEGRTSDAEYYLCVSNPGRRPAQVTVDFRFDDGATAQQSFTVPAGARYTMAVHQLFPDEAAVSAIVRGTMPIVAERSVFLGGGARGGATTLGIPLE